VCAARDHQLAADASFGGKSHGAATYFLLRSLADMEYDVSYRGVVDRMYDYLRKYGFEQQPELNGNVLLMDRGFLSGKGGEVSEPGDTTPQPIPSHPKKNFLEKIISAIVSFFKKLFNR
jgi:hypothetical protein